MPDEVRQEEQEKPKELDDSQLDNVAGGTQNAPPADRRGLPKVMGYIGETEKNLRT